MSTASEPTILSYAVSAPLDGWELSDEPMPESVPHYAVSELLREILAAWIARTGKDAFVARNLAVRWEKARPQIGADPDVCLLVPRPPEADRLRSVRTWLPGHAPPALAIEVVSDANPKKDYSVAPEKHAANGTRELWVFDPERLGRDHGGPFLLQLWCRGADGRFDRSYVGDGPFHSPVLGAWVLAEPTGYLRICGAADGSDRWLTAEEAERAAKEAALAERDAALARLAALERALAAK